METWDLFKPRGILNAARTRSAQEPFIQTSSFCRSGWHRRIAKRDTAVGGGPQLSDPAPVKIKLFGSLLRGSTNKAIAASLRIQ